MKKTLPLIALSLFSLASIAQIGLSFGIKAGINFANVTNASSINAGNRTGYMFGGYIAPKAKKMLRYRSEIILSRQGYDYKTNTNTGKVNLDYLLLPQLITLNFSKYIQLQIGGQAAFLLNAKVDSTGGSNSGSLLSYFNRFNYGLVGGAEVFPIKIFFIGARFNTSFNKLTKGGSHPDFIPGIDAKSNVVQLYVGARL